MFVTRRITAIGSESNTCIGKSYNIVRKVENEAEYKETLKAWLLGLKRSDDDVYGFIVYDNGSKIMPLYKGSVYFIMMSDGKTFANVTNR